MTNKIRLFFLLTIVTIAGFFVGAIQPVLARENVTNWYIQDFETEIIEPALIGGNNKLIVQNNIYILDNTNKRIIIYSKDGKFIKQYASASFNDINNFTVDEKNSKIYLVSGNKIKKIDIE